MYIIESVYLFPRNNIETQNNLGGWVKPFTLSFKQEIHEPIRKCCGTFPKKYRRH